ncbi:hypothetical protein CU044_6142 [Streptomyces sp. L-9-10]|nr:hypothetical protein CU044_6142 [Streptomyces sp. L-9-10]
MPRAAPSGPEQLHERTAARTEKAAARETAISRKAFASLRGEL